MYKRFCIFLLVLSLVAAAGSYGISSDSDIDELWRSFLETNDSKEKHELLVLLADAGKENKNIIYNLNNYLIETCFLFSSGMVVDYSLVSACIAVLMELDDSSSYTALFTVLRSGYPEVIVSEASGALDLINGNLKLFLAGIIEKNPPQEKFAAFKAGINSERLSVSERGQLAELALELAIAAGEDNMDLNALRYSAVWTLADLRWKRANSLSIRNYYRVQADYQQGIVPKARLIEAITCLGAVGNSDAALALGLQLSLINAGTESTGIYDADITLAIIQALGLIGDNGAFNHLLSASNLQYSENIIIAAKEAIDRLKWQ